MLCNACQWLHRPLAGVPAEAGSRSASNLSKTEKHFWRGCKGCGEQMPGTTGEVKTNLCVAFFYGVGRPTKTYIHQLCVDTGCSQEDPQAWWMIGMDGEREKVRNSVSSVWLDYLDEQVRLGESWMIFPHTDRY